MIDHLTHENFWVDLPRAECKKMRRERYRKWMKWKERQGWDSGNFLEKMCGGAEEGEESCFNFRVYESCVGIMAYYWNGGYTIGMVAKLLKKWLTIRMVAILLEWWLYY